MRCDRTPGVGNVPADLTSFIGRRREMADVKQALGASRLVTLVGVGGVGKTRLAIHEAAQLRRAFPHGAWFVDLSALHDEELLASTVATALGCRAAHGHGHRLRWPGTWPIANC